MMRLLTTFLLLLVMIPQDLFVSQSSFFENRVEFVEHFVLLVFFLEVTKHNDELFIIEVTEGSFFVVIIFTFSSTFSLFVSRVVVEVTQTSET